MSESLKNLQKKVGCSPDGAFGPNTARGITKYYEWSPERGAHMLGQLVHESGTFKTVTENLNYSADGLLKTHSRYFKTREKAEQYARQPEKIANYIYDETIPFVFMGMDHVISIIVFAILSFSIPYLAQKNLDEDQQYFLGKIIGVLILFGYLSWVILEILAGTFSKTLHLPFHLCRAANILIFIVLFFRSFWLMKLYFFGD